MLTKHRMSKSWQATEPGETNMTSDSLTGLEFLGRTASSTSRLALAVMVLVGCPFGLARAARRQVCTCSSGPGKHAIGRRTISGTVSGTGVSESGAPVVAAKVSKT